ncbi:outer membrane beta-barrel protein [Terriglobus aquaticus]|uniref:Outer membrane beta-barrel protein n=1 Tax=Terriglobus aquaticus TaxID=940139 RepID=A0ABW9KLB3_9BACT|nr:outer membrane beta-barrel protein [Terriglobus aquaticus]
MGRKELGCKGVWLAALLGVAAMPAAAQRHEVEVGATYTYVRTNLVPGCNCFGTQGGSGLFTVRLSPTWQALGEVDVTHRADITANGYDLTQTVFTGGARYTPAWMRVRVRPFGDVLVGGAHAGGSLAPNNTGLGGAFAFAFQTGGGLQVSMRRWSIVPLDADYLLTTFQNGTGANRQNDLRLSAGVMFRIR